jgi:hypothetical protein
VKVKEFLLEPTDPQALLWVLKKKIGYHNLGYIGHYGDITNSISITAPTRGLVKRVRSDDVLDVSAS